MAAFQQIVLRFADQVLNPFIMFLGAAALAYFIYGVVEFILGAESEDKRERGKKHIMWGLIGLMIMFGVWSIINIIINFWQSVG
jgi:zinc transporter ZupT